MGDPSRERQFYPSRGWGGFIILDEFAALNVTVAGNAAAVEDLGHTFGFFDPTAATPSYTPPRSCASSEVLRLVPTTRLVPTGSVPTPPVGTDPATDPRRSVSAETESARR